MPEIADARQLIGGTGNRCAPMTSFLSNKRVEASSPYVSLFEDQLETVFRNRVPLAANGLDPFEEEPSELWNIEKAPGYSVQPDQSGHRPTCGVAPPGAAPASLTMTSSHQSGYIDLSTPLPPYMQNLHNVLLQQKQAQAPLEVGLLQQCIPCGVPLPPAPWQDESGEVSGLRRSKNKRKATSKLPPGLASRGSFGHPLYCGAPCKYSQRMKGCRDAQNCLHCHLCKWTRRTDGLRGYEKLDAEYQQQLDYRQRMEAAKHLPEKAMDQGSDHSEQAPDIQSVSTTDTMSHIDDLTSILSRYPPYASNVTWSL